MIQRRLLPTVGDTPPVYTVDADALCWLDGHNREPDGSRRYTEEEAAAMRYAEKLCMRVGESKLGGAPAGLVDNTVLEPPPF